MAKKKSDDKPKLMQIDFIGVGNHETATIELGLVGKSKKKSIDLRFDTVTQIDHLTEQLKIMRKAYE